MGTLNFQHAKQYALHRLERELSPNLLYHGIAHTRDDVVLAVKLLANMEGIHGDSLSLLLTAAWFHDLGFVEQPQYHELISRILPYRSCQALAIPVSNLKLSDGRS